MILHPLNFKLIADKSEDSIFVTKAAPLETPGPDIVYTNEAFNQLTGFSTARAVGSLSNLLETLYSDKPTTEKIREAIENRQPLKVSLRRADVGDQPCWLELNLLPMKNDAGEIEHFAFIERNITEHKQLQQLLEQQSEEDLANDLANQKSVDQILTREFSLFARNNTAYTILIIDVDHFKEICDIHGKSSAEKILKTMTTILGNTFRSYDEASRIGPDTFCILLSQTGLQSALITAIRFRQSIQKTAFHIADGPINITVSIGISEVNTDDTDPDDILKRARMAMLQARKSGGDQARIYDKDLPRPASPVINLQHEEMDTAS